MSERRGRGGRRRGGRKEDEREEGEKEAEAKERVENVGGSDYAMRRMRKV
jgi:hypothetical protein